MNGILPLWKPKGMTSHDCVVKIRKLFNTKKVGHTGTLDPEVEGVLAICIGHATKIVPYLTSMKKVYLAECSLGIATETEDAQGKVIEKMAVPSTPTNKSIEEALQLFRGEIIQVPPMYSAVKVKGKKLYEYARANKKVERPERKIRIYEIIHIPSEKKANENSFRLKIICSEGTYIRTLCVDIGKKLGYPAHMSDLTRIAASSFAREDTMTFKEIENKLKEPDERDLLVPIDNVLTEMDCLHINEEFKRKVLHGQKLKRPNRPMHSDPFLVKCDQKLLAIYKIHPTNPEQIKPVRVFNG